MAEMTDTSHWFRLQSLLKTCSGGLTEAIGISDRIGGRPGRPPRICIRYE